MKSPLYPGTRSRNKQGEIATEKEIYFISILRNQRRKTMEELYENVEVEILDEVPLSTHEQSPQQIIEKHEKEAQEKIQELEKY